MVGQRDALLTPDVFYMVKHLTLTLTLSLIKSDIMYMVQHLKSHSSLPNLIHTHLRGQQRRCGGALWR